MVGLSGRRVASRSKRRAGMLLGAALFGALAVACNDAPVAAPKHFGPGHASLSLSPRFAALPAGAPSIQLSKITAALVGPNGDSIFVTSTFDGDSAILVFDLQITGSTENFTLNLTAFDHDGVVAYKSTQSVAIKPGDNPGVPAPLLVYAAPDAAIQTLHVSPSSMSMNAGTSGSLSVTGTGANGQSVTPLRIGWTSRDPSIATVDDGGGVQAGAFQGSTWIVARTPNNVADSSQITVKAAVAQVSLSASSLQLVRGTGGSIVARLLDSGGHTIDDRVATWSSSDPSVATVSSSGAVQGLKVGTATLTATAEGKSATATVSVVSPIDHIELSPSSLTFASLGQSQRQTVVAKIVARAGASVDGLVPTLTSANPFIASVDGSGTVTPLSSGSTTITAVADGVSATAPVTVKQVAVSVTVSPASTTITAVGDATTFTAVAFDAAKNAVPASTIVWSSSDASVASVNSDGVAVALKGGSTTITATTGAISGSGTLAVSQIAQKIALSPDKTSFMVTQSATVTARVLDQNDNTIPAVKPQWSSATPTIASVTQDGTVTGLAVGTARITAAYDGVTANISLQVTSLPAVTLTLNASSANLLPSGTAQFSVTAGGTGPFAWTVNDVAGGTSTIGTVSASGLYTAPSTVTSPASVSVCATQVSPPGHVCATVTISTLPVLDVSSTSAIVGNTHSFSVASGGNGPFTWLVNNTVSGNATFGTITSSGLYTAPAAVPTPATFDVCATQTSPAATACSHVTVLPVQTTTLALNVSTAALRTGAFTTFAVVSGGTGPFTWTVNNTVGGNSTVGTVDGSGLYTAPATAPVSPVSVCASQVNPTGTGCVVVTVSAPPTLDVSTFSLFTSGTHQFVATGGTSPFTWSVNNVTGGNTTVGTVSGTGLYTAPTTLTTSPTTVNVCVSQATPLAQTCALVSISAVTLTLNVTSIEKLPGGTQAFTVSGGTGPYTWSVNGVTNGNATSGTVSASGNTATYTAPPSVPTPSTFNLCVSQASPSAVVCAQVTIDPIPSSGGEVIVFNDENMFDDSFGSPYATNRLFYQNLVTFTATGARAAQTGVMMHRGHNSVCGTTECSESSQSGFRNVLTTAGFTITDVDGASATITSIPSSIKAIFLWMPVTSYSVSELNVLKRFASEGGRIIFVGERAGYYGAQGITTENNFFIAMGAQMANQGGDIDCGHVDLPQSSLRSHQITQGLTGLAVACASQVILGPNDYALFYDSSNSVVLGAVAKVDLTPLSISSDRALRSVQITAPPAPRTEVAGRLITGWSATPVNPPPR